MTRFLALIALCLLITIGLSSCGIAQHHARRATNLLLSPLR